MHVDRGTDPGLPSSFLLTYPTPANVEHMTSFDACHLHLSFTALSTACQDHLALFVLAFTVLCKVVSRVTLFLLLPSVNRSTTLPIDPSYFVKVYIHTFSDFLVSIAEPFLHFIINFFAIQGRSTSVLYSQSNCHLAWAGVRCLGCEFWGILWARYGWLQSCVCVRLFKQLTTRNLLRNQ